MPKRPRALPFITGPLTPLPGWQPNKKRSSKPVACRYCQTQDWYWSYSATHKKSILVDALGWPHVCPTPHKRDVFPGWCEKCHAPDLLWLRKKTSFELTESFGLPHPCGLENDNAIQEMSSGRCKYCNTDGLIWVQVGSKYILNQPDGTKHTCAAFNTFMQEWAEAKRINYAFEKAWLKSKPDDSVCKKCKGEGFTSFISKSKANMQKYNSADPIPMRRPCLKCKRLGIFTSEKKKFFLKQLRKKYWPFRGGIHKWKTYGF